MKIPFNIYNIKDTTVTFQFYDKSNDPRFFDIEFNHSWHGGCIEQINKYLLPYMEYVAEKVIPAMADVRPDDRGVYYMTLPSRTVTSYTSLYDLDLIYALVEAVTGAKRGAGSIPSIVWHAK